MMSAECRHRQFTQSGVNQCKRPALWGRLWCGVHQKLVEYGREHASASIPESTLTIEDMAWSRNDDE